MPINNNEFLKKFIQKARAVHGDKYDYSKVDYVNANTKVCIICPEHGEFWQIPHNHLQGQGCRKCGLIKRIKKRSLTKEQFIEKSKQVHGNKYDYSKVEYINSKTKVCIICSEHGEFWQTPTEHIQGYGCRKCAGNEKLTTEQFIEKARKIHGNKYDYSKVNYINNQTKVCVICPEHGEFWQTPSNHLMGYGCKKCAGNEKLTTEQFIEKAREVHGNKYDYHKTIYNGSMEKVCIICPIHGEFWQLPSNHMKGNGCNKCATITRCDGIVSNTVDFIEKARKIHGNKYDYSKVEYVNNKTKVCIICQEHGGFWQRPNDHLNNNGCSKCGNLVSNGENELVKYIENFGFIIQKDRKILNGLELDMYVPEKKIAIEYDGLYWHNELYKNKTYHLSKTEKCIKEGIQLIHIFEDEWLQKQDIVKSRLKNLLGVINNKIYARKCIIKEIDNNQCSVFLNNNHIQGKCQSSIRIGLFYNDELVSVMTFGKQRTFMNNKNKSGYEMIRFCNKLNTIVVGGASKLFKYFVDTYNPFNVTSYADRRWSNGKLYERLGFELSHKSNPSYFYVIGNKRIYRYNMRKDVLVSKYGCPSEMSEHDFCLSKKWYRIYDCGTLHYEWKNKINLKLC